MPPFPQAPTTRNKITQLGHSHPFNHPPPPVTHHPKPPKDTLRFLLNMVAAEGPQVPAMSPGLLSKGPAVVQQGQHQECRAGRPAWHLPYGLPPNLGFLWVRLQGQEVCPAL